jgi:hypothetical protein
MFLPFILSASFGLPSTVHGFSLVSLIPNRSTTINISGRTAIIFDAPLHSFNYTVNVSTGGVIGHSHPFSDRHLLLTGDFLSLEAISRAISLPMWILPDSVCGTSSVILNSKHFLQFTAKSSFRPNPFCLFSQSQFDEVDIVVIVKSGDEQTSITFHGVDAVVRERCQLAEKCRFHEHSPFFLRIQGNPNVTTAFKLEYEISVPSPSAANCSIFAVKEGGSSQIAQILENPQFSCKSQAEDILEVIVFGGIGLIILFLVFSCINGWGIASVGEWLFRDTERQRFASLKKAPFANNLGDAHVETPIEKL